MGNLQALEMARLTDRTTALTWHLRSNHYPPVPLEMVPVCEAAIQACQEEDPDQEITLPDGVSYRGSDTAPAWAIVEGHHLEAWLQDESDDWDGAA